MAFNQFSENLSIRVRGFQFKVFANSKFNELVDFRVDNSFTVSRIFIKNRDIISFDPIFDLSHNYNIYYRESLYDSIRNVYIQVSYKI